MTSTRQQLGYGLPDQAQQQASPSSDAESTGRGRWLRHLRGDLTGGVAAAVLTIPVSMGYGMLALSGLGDAYIPQAILAGLWAPVFGCFVALLLGANTAMIYSPRSIVTFLIGSIVLQNFTHTHVPYLANAPGVSLLVLPMLLVFLAGFFQLLFGLLRLGTLVKYIAAPVFAGFPNAAASLIFLSQVDSLLGFRQHVASLAIPAHLGEVQPLTLLVGVITCMLILKGARLTKRIPPTLIGLIGGIAAYYALAYCGLGSELGPLVGSIPFAWPDPHYFADFLGFVADPRFRQVIPALVGGALSLAIIASLDGIVCARLIESDSGNRVEGNLELIRLGAGNMVAAGFGGLANGINLGSSFANHRSGARTRLSVLVHALVILFAILLLSPLISYLPRVVIAGMLAMVAIQLVDRWTLQILAKLVKRGFSSSRSMLLDLLVILSVTAAAVAANIVIAVVLGIVITILLFLFRMSKSVVRRGYRCDSVHSRKTRDPKEMEYLGVHGAKIAVIELEGPIFFGTAENLGSHIDSVLREDTSCVVIDLKRVNEIDSTGARILLQTHDRLKKEGKTLLLSAFGEQTRLAGVLEDMGVLPALTRERLFQDTDRAIEWAEDRLLQGRPKDAGVAEEYALGRLDAFARMQEEDLAVIGSMMSRRVYGKGEVIFREGDDGRELYVIAKGSASVRMRLPGGNRATRLVTFSAGTVFGEFALLDLQARSATIEADEDLVCYLLSHASFERLTEQHPAIAINLLVNLGRELSGRLRRANRTIYQLEF